MEIKDLLDNSSWHNMDIGITGTTYTFKSNTLVIDGTVQGRYTIEEQDGIAHVKCDNLKFSVTPNGEYEIVINNGRQVFPLTKKNPV